MILVFLRLCILYKTFKNTKHKFICCKDSFYMKGLSMITSGIPLGIKLKFSLGIGLLLMWRIDPEIETLLLVFFLFQNSTKDSSIDFFGGITLKIFNEILLKNSSKVLLVCFWEKNSFKILTEISLRNFKNFRIDSNTYSKS